MATPHGVNAGRVQGKDLRCRSVLSSVAARKCQDPEDASCGARKKMLCGGSRVKRQGGHQTSRVLQPDQPDAQNMLGPFARGYESGRWLVRCLSTRFCLQPRPTARAVTSPEAPWRSVPAQVVSARGCAPPRGVTANGQPDCDRSPAASGWDALGLVRDGHWNRNVMRPCFCQPDLFFSRIPHLHLLAFLVSARDGRVVSSASNPRAQLQWVVCCPDFELSNSRLGRSALRQAPQASPFLKASCAASALAVSPMNPMLENPPHWALPPSAKSTR